MERMEESAMPKKMLKGKLVLWENKRTTKNEMAG
jgi:hypothetical protein